MSDNVDRSAIAPWSGYNFQGLISILIVLETMNKNINDISSYEFDIEGLEDLIIKKNSEIVQAFQVKATLSKASFNNYKDACDNLKKILDKHNQCELFLVSASYVNTGLDAYNAVNGTKIRFYDYKPDPIRNRDMDTNQKNEHLRDRLNIVPLIENEIEKLQDNKLIRKGVDKTDLVWLLINFIFNKISFLHPIPKKVQKSYISTSFDEVVDYLNKAVIDKITIKNTQDRYQLYLNIIDTYGRAKNIECKHCNRMINDTCQDLDCAIHLFDERFVECLNQSKHQYIKALIPNKTIKEDNASQFLEYFTEVLFRDNITGLVSQYQSSDLVIDENSIEFSNVRNGGEKIVSVLNDNNLFPTVIELHRRNAYESSLQTVLKELNNSELFEIIKDKNIIIKNLKDNKINIDEKSISFISKEEGGSVTKSFAQMNSNLVDADFLNDELNK